MSAKKNKPSSRGIRYSDEVKKQVVEFVTAYNKDKGRGGQNAAAKKFKVTPLTISGWLKSAGVKSKAPKAPKAAKAPKAPKAPKASKAGKAPKAAKAAKAPKAAPVAKVAEAAKAADKPTGKAAARVGRGYSAEFKREVIDFVKAHDAAKGRGGQSQAAKKYKLSILTVSSWLKKAGVKVGKGRKVAAKAAVVAVAKAAPSKDGSKLSGQVASLLDLGGQIRRTEGELQKLRERYDSLSAAIRASL